MSARGLVFLKKTHALFHKEYLANLERIEERIGLNWWSKKLSQY